MLDTHVHKWWLVDYVLVELGWNSRSSRVDYRFQVTLDGECTEHNIIEHCHRAYPDAAWCNIGMREGSRVGDAYVHIGEYTLR